MTFQQFEWSVVLLHAANSFQKTRKVTAINYQDAAAAGLSALKCEGYDDGDFVVVSVTRGRST